MLGHLPPLDGSSDRRSESSVVHCEENPCQNGGPFVRFRPLIFGRIWCRLGLRAGRCFGCRRLVVVLGVALAPWCGSRGASRLLDFGLRVEGFGSEFRLGIRSGVRFALEGALGSVLPRLEVAGP